MSHIKLTSLVLDENIEIPNVVTLKDECKTLTQKLIDCGNDRGRR